MPIELKNSCLSCHTGSASDIYGVFSLTTSLDTIISQTRMITVRYLGGNINNSLGSSCGLFLSN